MAENERRAQRFVALAHPRLRVVIHSGALADEPRVSGLLAAHGYREVRRTTLMRIDFDGEPAPPAAPAGIDVRPLLPENAEELFSAHREAFADTWGEGEETYEDFRHHLLDRPEFDPEFWFLAWHGRNCRLPRSAEGCRRGSDAGMSTCLAFAVPTGVGA